MLRILVVDDQAKIRAGIKAMIENMKLPFALERVFTAQNGLEALRIMQEQTVDIVVSDIRMPDMDGLILMERVRENMQNVEFIVISGYDDFKYAQRALELGAKGYLLKPVERKKLQQLLFRLGTEQMAMRDMEGQAIRKRFESRVYGMLEEGKTDERTLSQIEERYPFICSGYHLALAGFPKDIEPEEVMAVWEEVRETPYAFLGENRRTIFFLFPNGKEAAETGEKITARDSVKMAVAGRRQGADTLREAFLEAREIYVHHYLFPQKKMLWDRDIADLKQDFMVPNREIERIKDIIGSCSEEELKDYVSKVFHRDILTRYRIGYLQAVCDTVYRNLREIESALPQEGDPIIRMEKSNHPLDFPDMRSYLLSLTGQILQLHTKVLEYGQAYKGNPEMEETIRYIRENYASTLTLAMVSNHVSLNYAYFSATFKKYTGKAFLEYLKDVRIENAKELLTRTDLRICEVAEKVGYDSYKNFGRVFKETVGITPAEYRKRKWLLKP